MLSKKLQEIDRRIIDLLSERIAILSEDKSASIEEQLSQVKPLLSEAGLPEFVWKDVVISCVAALATSNLANLETPEKRITIVGGTGMMGQFFKARFEAAGHQVKTLGRKNWDRSKELLCDADLALICVPIERTIEIIQETAKYLAPTAVLADITSIKAPMVEAMLKFHSGPVVGLHPMFGPGVSSFLSQKVVVCPGRGDEAFQWLVELMDKDGGDLVFCPPEEHDRMMIAVQALRHFATYSLGVFMAEEGVDIGRSLELSSPIYRLSINTVSRLFAQDAELYVDIMLATEERRKAIARLADTFLRLAKLVECQDREALMVEFDRTTSTFGSETDRALRESNRLIDTLSILLAAHQVEQSMRQ